MKKKIFQLIEKNILIKGSLVMLIGSVAGNFGNYLYHLLMGRMLGPSDYGILESLISLNYLLTIPISVLVLVIVKYVSGNKSDKEAVSGFIMAVIGKIAVYGFLGFILFLLLYPLLNDLIRVNSFTLFFGIGLATYFGIFGSVFASSLQGLAQFVNLSILNTIASWSKTLIAVALIAAGLKIFGSVYGFVLSSMIVAFIGFKFVKKSVNLQKSKERLDLTKTFSGIKSYGLSVFVFNLSMTSLYTSDIILSKYFLPAKEAGYYAALSILGKIVFFASSPITSVMFPIISEKYAQKLKFKNIFFQSVVLVLLISAVTSLLFFLKPGLMVGLLYGKDYLVSAKYLGYFAIFISIYSLCYLFNNLFLSLSEKKTVFGSLIAAILQGLLIFLWHKDIFQIIKVNIITVSFLFLYLFISYLFNNKKWNLSQ